MSVDKTKTMYEKCLKNLLLFDYLNFFVLKKFNFEKFFQNYLAKSKPLPAKLRSFRSESHLKQYLNWQCKSDSHCTVYIDLLTFSRLSIVSGNLYKLLLQSESIETGKTICFERIAFVEAQKKFSCNHIKSSCVLSSRQFVFNAGQQQRLAVNFLTSETEVLTATEMKIALVKQIIPDFAYSEAADTELLQKYFKRKRLLYVGDVISIQNKLNCDANVELFYKIVYLSRQTQVEGKNYSEPINFAFVSSKLTKCFELPPISGVNFPSQCVNWDTQFVPQSVCRVAKEIGQIFANTSSKIGKHFREQHIACNSEALSKMPLPVCLLSSVMSNFQLIIDCLADTICGNIYVFNCLDYTFSISGLSSQSTSGRKSLEEKIRTAIASAKQFTPCVIWLKNVAITFGGLTSNNDSSTSADFMLEILIDSLKAFRNSNNDPTKPSSCGVIGIVLTCQSDKIETLPPALTNYIHFNFCIDDLTLHEKKNYFWRKIVRTQNCSNELSEKWFIESTKGFFLLELDQLINEAHESAVIEALTNKVKDWKRPKIEHWHFEIAIDKRQAAIGKVAGVPKIPKVTWGDIGGLESVKELITESLQMNQVVDASGTENSWRRSGLLLYGPPGCGKTLIAKAVANEFKMTFLSVKGPELLNQYVGQSEKNLRDVFARARAAAPSILFFDELDSLAASRGSTGDAGGVMDRMVSQMLVEMDINQNDTKNAVFIIAATNRPDLIDPSLMTPGRFDKSVLVGPATDFESKLRILTSLCRRLKLDSSLTVEEIARLCPNEMSGAELSDLMFRASMNSLREKIKKLEAGNKDSKRSSNVEEIMDSNKLANGDDCGLAVLDSENVSDDDDEDDTLVICKKHIEETLVEIMGEVV